MLRSPRRRARRLELPDLLFEVDDEGADDRVKRRQRAVRQGGHRGVADACLEERRRDGALDLIGVEVEIIATDADEPDIEDEVGGSPRDEEADHRGLAPGRAGIDLEPVETRPTDLALLDPDRSPARGSVELDEQRLARAVLIEGDGLRGARVGGGDGARLAELREVPRPEGERAETGRYDRMPCH